MTETPNTTASTDVALADDIQRLKDGKLNIMSTFTGDDRGTKISILSAMTNTKPLDEQMGKELAVSHFVVQEVEMTDEETGELRGVPRVILVTDKGDAYHAISQGIYSSLKNITAILGMPEEGHWPVKVKVEQEKTRKGFKVFVLKITG